jgi:hypothetical protein
MMRITFDFRQRFRSSYGRRVVVATLEDVAGAIEHITGPDTVVTITEVRELTDAEYERWLDHERRRQRWSELAKQAKAYRGLL